MDEQHKTALEEIEALKAENKSLSRENEVMKQQLQLSHDQQLPVERVYYYSSMCKGWAIGALALV